MRWKVYKYIYIYRPLPPAGWVSYFHSCRQKNVSPLSKDVKQQKMTITLGWFQLQTAWCLFLRPVFIFIFLQHSLLVTSYLDSSPSKPLLSRNRLTDRKKKVRVKCASKKSRRRKSGGEGVSREGSFLINLSVNQKSL